MSGEGFRLGLLVGLEGCQCYIAMFDVVAVLAKTGSRQRFPVVVGSEGAEIRGVGFKLEHLKGVDFLIPLGGEVGIEESFSLDVGDSIDPGNPMSVKLPFTLLKKRVEDLHGAVRGDRV